MSRKNRFRLPRALPGPRIFVVLPLALALAGCPEPVQVAEDWASAPLPEATAPIDDRMANAGAQIFQRNCAACHSIGEGDAVGPDLQGVTVRRSMPWIHAMVARPDSMLRHDSIAIGLLRLYTVPMVNRDMGAGHVRAVLEFLRRADHPGLSEQAPGTQSAPTGDSFRP